LAKVCDGPLESSKASRSRKMSVSLSVIYGDQVLVVGGSCRLRASVGDMITGAAERILLKKNSDLLLMAFVKLAERCTRNKQKRKGPWGDSTPMTMYMKHLSYPQNATCHAWDT